MGIEQRRHTVYIAAGEHWPNSAHHDRGSRVLDVGPELTPDIAPLGIEQGNRALTLVSLSLRHLGRRIAANRRIVRVAPEATFLSKATVHRSSPNGANEPPR